MYGTVFRVHEEVAHSNLILYIFLDVKRYTTVVEEDAFFQNPLHWNVITATEVFFRQHNKVTVEVVGFIFSVFVFLFFSVISNFSYSGSFHYLPPKSRNLTDNDQNKCFTWNMSIMLTTWSGNLSIPICIT